MNQLHYNGGGNTSGAVVGSHQGHDEKKYNPQLSGQQDKMAAAAMAAAARAANAGYHYATPPPYNHQIPPAWQLAA